MYLNEKLPGLESPTKVSDPFSLEALIAWLEKQPQDARYCAADGGKCLFFYYYKSLRPGINYLAFFEVEHDFGPAAFEIAMVSPGTYGAALSRARHILETTR